MQVKIQNIGLIKNADLQVDGLTVITGTNDSGKSTVGKALFSLYHGINFYEKEINFAAVEYLLDEIRLLGMHLNRLFEKDKGEENQLVEKVNSISNKVFLRKVKIDNSMVEDIVDLINDLIIHIEGLNDIENKNIYEQVNKLKVKVKEINNPSFNMQVKTNTIYQIFSNEFSKRINNVYANGKALIEINDAGFCYSASFEEDSFLKFEGEANTPIYFKDVNFIDTPMIINELNNNNLTVFGISKNHTDDILDKLQNAKDKDNIIENTLRRENISIIDKKIREVLTGTVRRSLRNFEYEVDGEKFDVSMLATGLKTYSIIKILLDNGYLDKESLLIIDEPEIHLHPEWQIKFAELLVLIVKYLGIKMVLTTHSPYFLQSLEIFSKKYELKNDTHFYLAERQKDGAVFRNIDENIDETYKLLAKPLLALRKMMDDLED